MSRKHAIRARLRAFQIWQKLGYFPWKQRTKAVKKGPGDFYKGAFDSIPFLNDDAKRTFSHLLLRPGYMIRDYIRGDHERYLAPLTALIIFYAFFALVSSVLEPVQHKAEKNAAWQELLEESEKEVEINDDLSIHIVNDEGEVSHRGGALLKNCLRLVHQGYVYLTLDKHPEAVKTQRDSALAALESTLRSQGIPLFLGQFFLLWMAMGLALRRYRLGMSALAATSAYILCQFSFFMLFAVLFTWGESRSIGAGVMLILITLDLHQLLGTSWKRSLWLTIRTGLFYGLLFVLLLMMVSVIVFLVAWKQV